MFLQNFILLTFAVLVTSIVGIVTFFYWSFGYWKRKNMPYVEPEFPFGTMKNTALQRTTYGDQIKTQYDYAKSHGYRYVGLYGFFRPCLMIVDLQLVKHILNSDFQSFTSRGIIYDEKNDPLSANLFLLEGHKWKILREKLTPAFTTGKIKVMFETLLKCGNQLIDAVDKMVKSGEPIHIKEVVGFYSTDVIGSCAYGIDCNSFNDPDSDFGKFARKVFYVSKKESLFSFIAFCLPSLAKRFNLVKMPIDRSEFFLKMVFDTVQYREKNGVTRNDFLQILIDLKNNPYDEEGNKIKQPKLSINEIASQCLIFFLGGYESSSSLITFFLYEIARNPDIQERLRQEITVTLQVHDKFTYESLQDLNYMTQVINETLRRYSSAVVSFRLCETDYKIPDSNDIIEKGTPVYIPNYGFLMDPDYFPNPEHFDPERFNDENKSSIVPYSFLPFGEGPRICIGLRFGVMQTKVALALLVKNFSFELSDKTSDPLVMDPSNFFMTPIGGIWLKASRVSSIR